MYITAYLWQTISAVDVPHTQKKCLSEQELEQESRGLSVASSASTDGSEQKFEVVLGQTVGAQVVHGRVLRFAKDCEHILHGGHAHEKPDHK